MTCPEGFEMTQNRLPEPPTVVQPGEVVWVRVGDHVYIVGEEPESPPPRFWRVCTPDTPPVTIEPSTSTTAAPTATTVATTSTTTTTSVPAATTTAPSGPVGCDGPGWLYNGSDPAPCTTTTQPPFSPPHLELADTGSGLGLAGLGFGLVAAGIVVALASTRHRMVRREV
jgi:hypothetical protein